MQAGDTPLIDEARLVDFLIDAARHGRGAAEVAALLADGADERFASSSAGGAANKSMGTRDGRSFSRA